VQPAELGRALGERRLVSARLTHNAKHLFNHAGPAPR
jgi:hypothetical protein